MNYESPKPAGLSAHQQHPRHFQGSQYVYPVLSRRSRGISIGVNLCPNQLCNFNCLYCQVRRHPSEPQQTTGISLEILETELHEVIDTVQNGELYKLKPFDTIPPDLRRLNDIALSGDGEPTAAKEFAEVCRLCAKVKGQMGLDSVKIILITNASLLHRPQVRDGLAVLDAHQGQIWAKLDAGNENYFKRINQTEISYSLILDNIIDTARQRPLVIQSLLLRIDGQRMAKNEVADFADRLAEILHRGGKISTVQLHTVARIPRDPRASALSKKELEDIGREITARVSVPLEIFPG